jgi:hypothetical protein
VPAVVGVVDLRDLIVFQKQINLNYVEELKATVRDWSLEDEDLLRFCLGIEPSNPDILASQSAQNTFTFRSRSTDARFLGSALVDPAQVSGFTPSGRARYAVVLYVGYGPNALNVVSINGRLILNNGSHRAYALMSVGITHVPAVIQHARREDNLVIIQPVQQNTQLYLQHPRPPMLRTTSMSHFMKWLTLR